MIKKLHKKLIKDNYRIFGGCGSSSNPTSVVNVNLLPEVIRQLEQKIGDGKIEDFMIVPKNQVPEVKTFSENRYLVYIKEK